MLGLVRLELGERLGLIPTDRHEMLWVVDFPAFEWNEKEERWDPVHHPFTAPQRRLGGPRRDARARL